MTHGPLPCKCPKCGQDDQEMDLLDSDTMADQYINKMECPKCKTPFIEIYKSVYWSYLNKEDEPTK